MIIQKTQKKTIGKKKSLTTNFLSWICQPFSKRIQRNVPSGFSYSQKPNARKIQKFLLDIKLESSNNLPWSLPLAPWTRFQLSTLPQFYGNKENISKFKERNCFYSYMKHSFNHCIRCTIRNTTNKNCCWCLKTIFLITKKKRFY